MPEPPRLPDKFEWWNVRAELEDWFFRAFRAQAVVPPGTIAAYGATTAPEGWVLCDGTEYAQTKYPELYKIIGQDYGGNPGTFNVPDTTDLPILPTATVKWMIKV